MRNKNSEDSNFWIVYADLMAGLLFVFILLIGAIVIKYVYAQQDLVYLKGSLKQQEENLRLSQVELRKRKEAVAKVTDELISLKQENLNLTFIQSQVQEELLKLKKDKNTTDESLAAARYLLAQKAKDLNETQLSLSLKQKEIENIKILLNSTTNHEQELLSENEKLNHDLNQTKTNLNEASYTLNLHENEIAMLSKKLLDKTLLHQKLVEDLNITKAKIQNLTGIRIKVIQKLKENLGDKISVDLQSGAIRLPSSVLFDKGSFELKESSKLSLKATLLKYFDVLFNNKEIRQNLDKITIEGHTDSDGSYIYNLDLSQKRASALMEYIYSWDEIDNKTMQKYLVASGRSYTDLIYTNGKEDKDLSRRIEVKFSISNKKAINEIEKFLSVKN